MNKRKIAIIMDPIESIHPEKDTTFAIMLEAQRRGWEVFYLTYNCLYSVKDHVNVVATKIEVIDRATSFYRFLSPPQTYSLQDFDITLMRKDPPFDIRYLYATYLLDLAKNKGCFIVNDPTSIRDANEKIFATWFPQCCPPFLVTSRVDLLVAFLAEHKKIIIKPLGYRGGEGILLLQQGDPNIYASIELLTEKETLPIMTQRYLPEITSLGDKRLLMINGEPYPYALVRLPKQGDIRGNLSAGATSHVEPINERDRWIANEVGPVLKKKGLYFVGLDIIGEYLTEINVTSPTCVREIEAARHVNICKDILDPLQILMKNMNSP